jgi:histone deacetylase 1/2
MSSTCKLTKQGSDFVTDPTLYRSIVGALQYVTLTRPELSFPENKVCQFMAQPLEEHWKSVKKILRYLAGMVQHGLIMKPAAMEPAICINAFCDADWASDPCDRKSTAGSCIYIGSNIVSWWSKKQNKVARSSAQAKYRSLAATTVEIMWLQSLQEEIQVFYFTPKVF